MTVVSLTPPSVPRLRVEPTGSRHTLLDGGWWPRSTDPVAELPGLVLAIDELRGPVTRLILAARGWETYPHRLGVAHRIVLLTFFVSQPVCLLTALCANRDRVDLLIIPPQTADGTADAAMILAATTENRIHAEHILLAVSALRPRPADNAAEQARAADVGPLRAITSLSE